MSELIDKYGRELNYLRLSVTDRCNLRCYYCMPETGIHFERQENLLTWQEMETLCRLFCDMGIQKIRITGGEPFVRPGLMPFLEQLRIQKGLEEITITTNGTLLESHIPALQKAGIRKINLSLDSLNRQRFFEITRRDAFDQVYAMLFRLLDAGFELKLNCVVSAGKNIEDIIPFVELGRNNPIAVRFLEEMPFNGGDHDYQSTWNYQDIYNHIQTHYSQIEKIQSEPSSTSINYQVPGFQGSFGIIPSFSRTFCGTCNRIRLSATGELRTCLYGPPVLQLRNLLRSGVSIDQIRSAIISAIGKREKDGFAAEQANAEIHHSMSILGG